MARTGQSGRRTVDARRATVNPRPGYLPRCARTDGSASLVAANSQGPYRVRGGGITANLVDKAKALGIPVLHA